MDLEGGLEVCRGGEAFDAVREANLAGGERNGVEVEVREGGVDGGGIGGSGDDGNMLAAGGKEYGYVTQRDHVPGCKVWYEVKFQWPLFTFNIHSYCSCGQHKIDITFLFNL